MDYMCYKEAWEKAVVGNLRAEMYLKNSLWRSMLAEDEIVQVVNLINAFCESKTFADFLAVAGWSLESFAKAFDRDEAEVKNWIRKETPFPSRLKQQYAFMMTTNYIAFCRQRMCLLCGEAFLSSEDKDYCECCCQVIKKEQEIQKKMSDENNTIRLQIEVIHKSV